MASLRCLPAMESLWIGWYLPSCLSRLNEFVHQAILLFAVKYCLRYRFLTNAFQEFFAHSTQVIHPYRRTPSRGGLKRLTIQIAKCSFESRVAIRPRQSYPEKFSSCLRSFRRIGPSYTNTLWPTRKFQELLSSYNSNTCWDSTESALLLYPWEKIACDDAPSIRDIYKVRG